MTAYPITLGVSRPYWGPVKKRQVLGQVSDDAETYIFQRDDYTCQCCGFRALKYQKLLHINGDSRDFTDTNVITTCVFCYQCFHLDQVSKMGSGVLIWLPELSQVELNHVMRAIYVARVAMGKIAETARYAYEQLIRRSDEAKRRLGSHDPEALAIVMRDFLTTPQYNQLQARIDGIRLMPLDKRMIYHQNTQQNEFAGILVHWRSKEGPFADVPVQKWAELFEPIAELA